MPTTSPQTEGAATNVLLVTVVNNGEKQFCVSGPFTLTQTHDATKRIFDALPKPTGKNGLRVTLDRRGIFVRKADDPSGKVFKRDVQVFVLSTVDELINDITTKLPEKSVRS